MSTGTPAASPLEHDAAREAASAMRGFSYQILTSIREWIGLADGQALFLEGAEDLDIVDDDAATAIQVKDTSGSGNITLRTPGVIAAIGHFWDHRARNRGRRVSFRYLTTSGVGQENGAPFGQDGKGIDLWEQLKTEPDTPGRTQSINQLKNFLRAETRLPDAFRQFLGTATHGQLLEDLVVPIEWVTAAPSSSNLLQLIKDQLILHGDRKGIDALTSENVLNALHAEAWRVATKENDRALDRAGFLRLFDQHTRVSVPSTTIETLLAMTAGRISQQPVATVVERTMVVSDPPPLPLRYYSRPTVLGAIAAATPRIVVVLSGATGTGKTTAATSYCVNSGIDWGWVDLRECDAPTIATRLSLAGAQAERSREPLSLVLDDLDCSKDVRPFESSIARLVATQIRRGAALILTAAHDLPPRLCQALGIQAQDIIRMPPFNREEILDFLAQRGCHTEWCEALAGIIELMTQGHPQLVHARVAALELAGFPRPSVSDLMQTPPDVLDVQAEARRLVAQLHPSSRELLYRLSLMVSLMDRERIMAIAAISPSIDEPGNAVDRLAGPWIEIVSPDIFRISPLIKSSGQQVNGLAWARDMNGLIAQAFLARRSLTPGDVSAVLLHALAAGQGDLIATLSMGLLHASKEVWRAIAEMTSWFALVAIEPGTDIPTQSHGGLLLVRMMQYRIAVSGDHLEAAHSIVTRFDEEFSQSSTDVSVRLARFVFLNDIVLQGLKHTMDENVALCSQYIGLADQMADTLASTEAEGPTDPYMGSEKRRDYASIVGWALAARIADAEDLHSAVHALDAIPTDHARRMLLAFGNDESMSRTLLDQVWLVEHQREAPDWERFRALLQSVCSLARRLDVLGLACAAGKLIVRVTDEDLDEPDRALSLADELATEIGEFPALVDARARVLSHRGEDHDALALWTKALPAWQTDADDFAPSFAHRDAALSAARLGQWDEAARFFSEGAKRASSSEQDAFRAGMLVDAGFAYWKAGDNVAAVESFAAGVGILDQLRDGAAAEPVRSVQRRASHTLMWVSVIAEGRSPGQFVEPPAAFCSNLEPLAEPIPSLPPLDFVIEHLLHFELSATAGDTCWRQYDTRLRNSPYVVILVSHSELNVRRCLATLDMIGLMSAAIDLAENLEFARHHLAEERGAAEPLPPKERAEFTYQQAEMVKGQLFLGVHALAARGTLDRVPVAEWRETASARGVEASLATFLDTSADLFRSTRGSAWAFFGQPPSGQWWCRGLAALALSVADDTQPLQMIWCHGDLVSYLVQTLPPLGIPLRNIIAKDLELIVTQAWRRLAGRPFLLRSPMATVPAIESAIDSPTIGWNKARAVLRAALQGVSLPSDNPARIAIEGMPEM